jgi:Arf-GAP/Rho-GAP domain/ANK repeat/PH domain-containing protein 1
MDSVKVTDTPDGGGGDGGGGGGGGGNDDDGGAERGGAASGAASAAPGHSFSLRIKSSGKGDTVLTADSMQVRDGWVALLEAAFSEMLASRPACFDFATCDHVGFLRWAEVSADAADAADGDGGAARFGDGGASCSSSGGSVLQRAYFAVKDKELLYFGSDTDATATGFFDTSMVTGIVAGKAPVGPTGLAPSVSADDGSGGAWLNFTYEGKGVIFEAESADIASQWVTALKNTQVFGSAIELSSTLVPQAVEKCCFYIENRGLFVEGIYRLPGRKAKVEELRRGFNSDDDAYEISSDQHTVHDVGSLLKQYFRELPNPLLTVERYGAFVAAAGMADHYESLEALYALVYDLPTSNFETLKRMCIHLNLITEHAGSNKMAIQNVALVFGPTLMTSDAVAGTHGIPIMGDHDMYACIEKLITYHEWIFRMEEKSEADLKMKEGRMRLEAATLEANNRGVSVVESAPTILEIFFGETETACTLPVTPDMSGSAVATAAAAKQGVPASDSWCIEERITVQERKITRTLDDHEPVLAALARWDGPGELRLVQTPVKALLSAAVLSTKKGFVFVKGKWWTWKKVYAVCDMSIGAEPALSYFKDEKSATELGRIQLSGSNVYFVDGLKRAPVGFCFAVKPIGSSAQDSNSFRYCCVEDQADLHSWAAALIVAKDRDRYAATASSVSAD